MKFKLIHSKEGHEDEVIVEGDTIQDIQRLAKEQGSMRGWDEDYCHSEEMKD